MNKLVLMLGAMFFIHLGASCAEVAPDNIVGVMRQMLPVIRVMRCAQVCTQRLKLDEAEILWENNPSNWHDQFLISKPAGFREFYTLKVDEASFIRDYESTRRAFSRGIYLPISICYRTNIPLKLRGRDVNIPRIEGFAFEVNFSNFLLRDYRHSPELYITQQCDSRAEDDCAPFSKTGRPVLHVDFVLNKYNILCFILIVYADTIEGQKSCKKIPTCDHANYELVALPQ